MWFHLEVVQIEEMISLKSQSIGENNRNNNTEKNIEQNREEYSVGSINNHHGRK